MPPNKIKRAREDLSDDERPTKKPCAEGEMEIDLASGDGPGKMSKGKQLKSPTPVGHQKPAELFRKDLISAMKLADSEQLAPEEFLYITDSWKQDWEKGVQVPVNEELIHEPNIKEKAEKSNGQGDFKIPRKFLHAMKDDIFKQGEHELTGMQQLAEQVVRYDLDDLDVCWLERMNDKRMELGQVNIHEWTMERVIEGLEFQYYEQAEKKKKTEEGLGIEYDEDIVCEVCRSPESEECNEMVFCDGCDICVHQACYGIQKIPEGSWLCRACALGIKPKCILCPRTGGAMKSTRSGTKWAHVSCALWIPEVSIGCAEKMEPITKISHIPASRWALVCTLCKERTGACIQCCVKACKTAFHVSCAHHSNLVMKTILTEDASVDGGLKLKGYCPRHSKNRDRRGSESDTDSPRKSPPGSPRKGLSDEEIAAMRAEKMKKLQEEFYSIINIEDLARGLDLDLGVIACIYEYWKLKRKAGYDAAMLPPKTEEEGFFEKQQEDSLLSRMKMFVQLRQDLERVRNLCYMVSKREKMKKQYYKSRVDAFRGLNEALTDSCLSDREAQKIAGLYPEDNIYYHFDPSAVYSTEDVSVNERGEIVQMSEGLVHDGIVQDDDTQDYIPEFSALSGLKDCGDVNSALSFAGRIENVIKATSSKMTLESDKIAQTKKERYKRKKELKERNFCDVFIMSPDEVDVNKSGDYKLRSATLSGVNIHKSETVKNEKIRRKTIDTMEIKQEVEEVDETPSSPSKWELRTRRNTCERDSSESSKSPRDLRSSSFSVKDEPPQASVIRNLSKTAKASSVSERVKAELNSYILNSKLGVADYIKDTVQKGLLETKRILRNNFINGMIDRTKKKENLVVNGKSTPPKCLSPVNGRRSISRVLNEISPSRASTPSENSWCRNLRGSPRNTTNIIKDENLSDFSDQNSPGPTTRSVRRRIDNGYDSDSRGALSTRSSRENSPASLRSFVRRDLKHGSDSPSSRKSFSDSNHGFLDVENVYSDSDTTPMKRVTRSQVLSDTENSRDSLDFKGRFSNIVS